MAIFDKLIFIREEASVSKIEKKKSLFLQNCQQVNFFFLCFFSVALWSKEISFVHSVLHELKVWKGSNTQLAGLLLSRWRPDIGCSVVCILFGSWWFYAIREFCTKKPMACMHACTALRLSIKQKPTRLAQLCTYIYIVFIVFFFLFFLSQSVVRAQRVR